MSQTAEHQRFVALVEGHKKILFKVAAAYCHDREDRLDLVQETVYQLWRSFHKFDDRAQFSTWMYRIALNVAISFSRARKKQTVELDDQTPAPPEKDNEEAETLYRMIANLDELSRSLIILTLDGFSHNEIADILGISPTNVSTRVARVKQRLQDMYESEKEL